MAPAAASSSWPRPASWRSRSPSTCPANTARCRTPAGPPSRCRSAAGCRWRRSWRSPPRGGRSASTWCRWRIRPDTAWARPRCRTRCRWPPRSPAGRSPSRVAGRVKYFPVLVFGGVVFLAVFTVYGFASPAFLFVGATTLLGFIGVFTNPFFVPMTIDADPSRRTAVQNGAAQILGGALGPLLASRVVSDANARGSLVLGGGARGDRHRPRRLAAADPPDRRAVTGCYTDRWSARPGRAGGAARQLGARAPARSRSPASAPSGGWCLAQRVEVGDHPRPAHADRDGCGWPAACEIAVGADWPSGYYRSSAHRRRGRRAHHFVCVKPAQPARQGGAGARAPTPLPPTTSGAGPAPMRTWSR